MADTANQPNSQPNQAIPAASSQGNHHPPKVEDLRQHIPAMHQRNVRSASYLGVNCSAGEEVYMVIRRHWLFESFIWLRGIFLAGAPTLIWWGLKPFLGLWQNIALICVLLYAQFVLFFVFKRWLDFYLDVIIVTSAKLIDIDQHGFFDRRMSETSLARVQDAGGNLYGVLGTILRFGTVEIQTAGSEPKFTLDHVGYPIETAAAIQLIQAEYLAKMGHLSGSSDQLINEV